MDAIRYFGFIVAYVIPGMIGLYAASYFSPVLQEWFGAASQQETTVGGFLFVIVGSLGMGVFLSGVRWIVYDRALGNVLDLRVSLENSQRNKDATTEQVFQNLIAHHYQYYQFYSNTSVAILLLFVAWAIATDQVSSAFWGRFVVLVATEAALVYSAVGAMWLFKKKSSELLHSQTVQI